jgi:hypothetical protein
MKIKLPMAACLATPAISGAELFTAWGECRRCHSTTKPGTRHLQSIPFPIRIIDMKCVLIAALLLSATPSTGGSIVASMQQTISCQDQWGEPLRDDIGGMHKGFMTACKAW